MKVLCSSLLFLLAVGCAGQPGGSSVDMEAERSTLVEIDMNWSETTNNYTSFLDYFADDAVLMPPDAPAVSGKEGIGDFIAVLMDRLEFSLRWMPAGADVSSAGDLGYTKGNYELTVEDDDGNLILTEGSYLTVWKKQADGEWKVAVYIFNPDHPPA